MDLENFLNAFNEKFKEIKNKCLDNRTFNLLEISMEGYLKEEISNQEVFCFSSHYNQDIIEIYYNRNQIISEYIQDPSDLSNEQILFEISYLASHEYGHTLFCESSKKLREINADWKNIYNKYEKFNCFVFLRVFSEFFADLEAYKFVSTFPEIKFKKIYEYFESKLSHHSTTILPTTRNFKYGIDGIDHYLRPFLINLSFIYAYNMWDDLEKIFEENKLSELFKFLNLILNYFRKLIESYSDMNLRRKKINELLKILDKFFYDDLIFKNMLNPELQTQLHAFINNI